MNRISANLTRCSGGTCTGLDNPPGITFTTQWSLNTPVILKLAWNQAQGKFTFTVTDPATLATESKDIVYLGILADAGPPTSDFKDFRAANTVKNCSTGRKRNLIDVLVDNVKVRRAP